MILDQRPPPAAGPSVQDHQNLADESGNEPRCFACRAVRAAATCPPGRPARPPGGRLQHHGAATRHRAAGPDAGRIVRRVAAGQAWPRRSGRIPCATRSSPPPSTPASRCRTSRKPRPTPTRAPPCGPPGRARVSLDRHATYIVAAYIAGAAR